MSVELLRRHRLSVDDFHRMAEAGILGPDDRVELIEGELIDMAPLGALHGGVTVKLGTLLQRRVGDAALVSIQGPLKLGPASQLNPDAMLLRPRANFYVDRLPEPADVLLLIEVSDTTLAYDRERKVPLYARHGVAEVWLIDLESNAVEVYRMPGPDGYGAVSRHGPGETIAPAAFPGIALAVADLLP